MSARRSLVFGVSGVLAACAGAAITAGDHQVPVEVFGADAEAIVVRCLVTRVEDDVDPGCWHAAWATQQVELLRRLGSQAAAPDRDDVSLVAVVMPGPPRLERVAIGSEEGVDVLTLVLGDGAAAVAPTGRTAILLWVERRPHQLAVVCRDVPADTEQTVGIFDGR